MRMVTRTITTTVVVTKCIDLDTMDIVDKTFTFGKVGTEEKVVARVINKELKDSGLQLVKIVGITEETALFGMTEEDFMKYSTVVR